MNNQNPSLEGKTKNITLRSVLAWIFGSLFLLSGFILIFSDFVTGLASLVSAAIILPYSYNLIREKTKISMSATLRTLVVLIIFGIAVGVSSAGKKENTMPLAMQDQKPIVENQVPATTTIKAVADTKAPAVQKTAPAPIPKQTAQAFPSFSGSGNYIVGTDIQSGTYRTRVGSSGCYYSRLSGFGGDLSDILSNEMTDYPSVVTISLSDKGFKTVRCATWTTDLSAITQSKTSFGNGVFITNTDFVPGTYRSTGGSGCYYSRLSGFSGELGDVIANEMTDSSAIVTIPSSDKGFKSVRCGTWTKIN